MEIKNKILFSRRFILRTSEDELTKQENAYYNSYLLINFGIELTNPELLNRQVMEEITYFFAIIVPPSFYKNPQDTKYFTAEELYIEQVVAYYYGYGTGMDRIELFKKVLPQYVVGTEIKLRTYTIIGENEAEKILKDVASSLAAYSRPFSIEEKKQFIYLYMNGYYEKGGPLRCKDNIISLLEVAPELGKYLDKKDVVKISHTFFSEYKTGLPNAYQHNVKATKIILNVLPYVQDCPMSKKQAKHYNKICRIVGYDGPKATNKTSANRNAILEIKKGNIVSAAKIMKKSGSLFLRNLVFLLSRANDEEAEKIFKLIPNDNVTVLLQLYNGIMSSNDNVSRVFRYYHNNVARSYVESEYETEFRKSRLSPEMKEKLANALKEKVFSYYKALPKLGKIYIGDDFKRVAVPFNTSASSSGIDVLPVGSRIKFDSDYIRTFVYWEDAFDIDASAYIVTKEELFDDKRTEEGIKSISWMSYHLKEFEEYALCSGDCTSKTGAEYQDFDINGLLSLGYDFIVYSLNGYGSDFGKGTIRSGIQLKKKIDTKAWDPKNIEFQMDVRGDCRSIVCFGVDLINREVIILNTMSKGWRIMTESELYLVKSFMSPHYLDFNIKNIISLRGDIVDSKEDADIVFDSDYNPKDNQVVVRPFDIAKLIELTK